MSNKVSNGNQRGRKRKRLNSNGSSPSSNSQLLESQKTTSLSSRRSSLHVDDDDDDEADILDESTALNDTCTAQISSLSALIQVSDIFDDDINDNQHNEQEKEVNVSINTTHLGANNSTMEAVFNSSLM